MRCVNFLEQADQGSISIDDIEVDAQNHSKSEVLALRRKTGFVFQNYALFAHMTARQNIAEGLITVRGWKKEQAHERAQQILDDIGSVIKVTATLPLCLVVSNSVSVLVEQWRYNLSCYFSMNRHQP
ncbi:ABC-type polar amino acid transport system ATPase component [Vibrio astriarenae]|nr:ABC-type polar amino acid transport system ATPase component [Vibrio sp. C7]